MHSPFQDLMRAATRLTRSGRLHDATVAIQRALRRASGADASPRDAARDAAAAGTASRDASGEIVDGCVFEAAPPADAPSGAARDPAGTRHARSGETLRDAPDGARSADDGRTAAAADGSDPTARGDTPTAPSDAAATPTPEPVARRHAPADREGAAGTAEAGTFGDATYADASGVHRYKLYVPPGAAGGALPLVVMLHGCTQDPDDFAAGTGMNDAARRDGFLVLYPIQPKEANPQRCWNWFAQSHQRRGTGEPEWIAGATRQVMRSHAVDPRRVYVAGLSAGGAMAAIVAAAYPELFAAAGVHSGLPRGAASNVAEALAVMKRGESGGGLAALAGFGSGLGSLGGGFARAAAGEPAPHATTPTPTIVFHGDQDRTVHPRNGEQVVAAALDAPAAAAPRPGATDAAAARVERGVSAHGRHYTRSTHVGVDGAARAEHWLVHGAGHAWSGGRSEGSYTDPKGPDATGAMLRFFRDNPRAS